MIDLKIGQIWQDWDIRYRGFSPRLLKVIGFPNDRMVEVENIKTGKRTYIAKYRMKPSSTGYILNKELI